MKEKRKLTIDDLQLESFLPEEDPGSVHAYISDRCSYVNPTDYSCSEWCGSQDGTCGFYTCAQFMGFPACASYDIPECSVTPDGGATCDQTCAQVQTCQYTGPLPSCCG